MFVLSAEDSNLDPLGQTQKYDRFIDVSNVLATSRKQKPKKRHLVAICVPFFFMERFHFYFAKLCPRWHSWNHPRIAIWLSFSIFLDLSIGYGRNAQLSFSILESPIQTKLYFKRLFKLGSSN